MSRIKKNINTEGFDPYEMGLPDLECLVEKAKKIGITIDVVNGSFRAIKANCEKAFFFSQKGRLCAFLLREEKALEYARLKQQKEQKMQKDIAQFIDFFAAVVAQKVIEKIKNP